MDDMENLLSKVITHDEQNNKYKFNALKLIPNNMNYN